jgi:serine/threonine-protein kinase
MDPFFSPESDWVGFFSNAALKKISLVTGESQTICALPFWTQGVAWGADDTIIFGTEKGRLMRVAAGGGAPDIITTPGVDKGERWHGLPSFLPDGKEVLFTIGTRQGMRAAILSLASGRWRELSQLGEASAARYLPSGHLVYAVAGRLMAVRFDPGRHQVRHSPVTIVEDLYTSSPGRAYFAASVGGSLAYVAGPAQERTLVLVDRQGKALPLIPEKALYQHPRFSPDGRSVAYEMGPPGNRDIWVLDLGRRTRSRLTFQGDTTIPVWTVDGTRIAFGSVVTTDLFWKGADGSSEAEPLLRRERAGFTFPSSWSPDGRTLAFTEMHPTNGYDIWVLPVEGDRTPSKVLATAFDEIWGVFSPDGRFLAYLSDETGRKEVYVRGYPRGGKWTVSSDGGVEPVWSADGRELFYRQGDRVMVVTVTTRPSFSAGEPQVLFQGRYDLSVTGDSHYDVSPDGRHFAMVALGEESAPARIHVVLNWSQELERLLPVR